jgi:hypothetical protein
MWEFIPANRRRVPRLGVVVTALGVALALFTGWVFGFGGGRWLNWILPAIIALTMLIAGTMFFIGARHARTRH